MKNKELKFKKKILEEALDFINLIICNGGNILEVIDEFKKEILYLDELIEG